MAQTRINLWLARTACRSRRAADKAISEGQVLINGHRAEPGMRVGESDRVTLNGKTVRAARVESKILGFVYHKPIGVICSERDDSARPRARIRAARALKQSLSTSPAGKNGGSSWSELSRQRWMMVGRLDVNSSGVLLFVNDGNLCRDLMHPSKQISRVYRVRVNGKLSDAMRRRLLSGIVLDNKRARLFSIEDAEGAGTATGRNRWYQVEIRQGMYREVRRLFASVGCRVSRLVRVRFGNIDIGDLDSDHARLLGHRQLKTLIDQIS